MRLPLPQCGSSSIILFCCNLYATHVADDAGVHKRAAKTTAESFNRMQAVAMQGLTTYSKEVHRACPTSTVQSLVST